MNSKENNHIDNWSIGPAIPFGYSHEEFPSSSCAASLTTQLAATDLEELSKAKQAEMAEHLKTCSACSTVLEEYQQLKASFVGCFFEEPETGKPESQLSPQLIQMWEEDGVDIVTKLGERKQLKMIIDSIADIAFTEAVLGERKLLKMIIDAIAFTEDVNAFQQTIKGEKDALIRLYENYIDRVYCHFYSKVGSIVEAQDLTSETFTHATEAIMRGQYVWQGKPFGTWLFAIAGHVLQERKRKLNRLPFIENLDTVLETCEPESQDLDIPDALVQKEEQTALWDVVKKLPFAEQQVLIMRYKDKLSYVDIAEHLGRSEATCKKLHSRALTKLKIRQHAKYEKGGN